MTSSVVRNGALVHAGPFRICILLFLAVVALLLTWFNGISNALHQSMMDFNTLYAGTRLFMEGGNPYFAAPLHDVLGPIVPNRMGVQITLPGVFGVLTPIGLIEHHTASMIWLAMNIVSILLSIAVLLKLTKLRWDSYYGAMLIVACLLLGPARMGIRQGQLDNMVLLLVLLSVLWVWSVKRRVASVVMLGLAMTLKPTSAGLFSIYLFCRGRKVLAIASLVLSGLIILVCVALLTLRVPEWWVVWAEVVASEENNFNKINALNPSLKLLTHLEAGFFAAFKSTTWASLAGYAICLPILARTLFSKPVGQDDSRETFLRELSIIAMVGLLVVYHRFYSAVFLVFPVAWAVYVISRDRASLTSWLMLSVPLLTIVNGQAAFGAVVDRHLVPFLTGETWFEQVLLQFHFVWLQLLVLLVLFAEHVRKTRFTLHVFDR
ncbi:glycosyltransferase 87 family protein [Granulosicoccus sp. 3-233]|uniref:glycosyltransferase 87 family protein n=1 Tax=Granulosicoccus sp. 3-233 TaxID=3417969 RepID=UPI003D34573E